MRSGDQPLAAGRVMGAVQQLACQGGRFVEFPPHPGTTKTSGPESLVSFDHESDDFWSFIGVLVREFIRPSVAARVDTLAGRAEAQAGSRAAFADLQLARYKSQPGGV